MKTRTSSITLSPPTFWGAARRSIPIQAPVAFAGGASRRRFRPQRIHYRASAVINGTHLSGNTTANGDRASDEIVDLHCVTVRCDHHPEAAQPLLLFRLSARISWTRSTNNANHLGGNIRGLRLECGLRSPSQPRHLRQDDGNGGMRPRLHAELDTSALHSQPVKKRGAGSFHSRPFLFRGAGKGMTKRLPSWQCRRQRIFNGHGPASRAWIPPPMRSSSSSSSWAVFS